MISEIKSAYIERKKINPKANGKGELFIPLTVVIIAIIGVVAVYSASCYSAEKNYGDKFFFAKKQLLGVVIGFAVMLFSCKFDYSKYKKIGLIAIIVSAVLLAIVFVPGIGVESYGAKRWVSIAGISFQPSEIAKFSLVFFVSGYISNRPERVNTFRGILPVLAVGGLMCLLVIVEPNMSVTVLLGGVTLCMLFFSGVSLKKMALILLPLALAIPLLIIVEPYRLKRLSAFLDPWASPKGEGYQLIQSLYALGSGGWFGTGFLNSRQKNSFLPFAESDFILSIIGEETGLIGLLILFALSLFLIYKGIKVSAKAKDLYGSLLACGITSVYALQLIINALVVTGCIPPTGIPLPLISSGNTSVVVFMFSFGVLYNVSCKAN